MDAARFVGRRLSFLASSKNLIEDLAKD